MSATVDAVGQATYDEQVGPCELADELFCYLSAVVTGFSCADDRDDLFGVEVGVAFIEKEEGGVVQR